MANKNKRTPQGANHSNIDELFRMLDQLESRNLGEDIEETILQYGYGDSPRPPAFVPDTVQGDLSDLLITGDGPDEMEAEAAAQEAAFLVQASHEDDVEDLPPPPEMRRNPFKVLGGFFAGNLPRRGDNVWTTLRKGCFWLSLLALLVAIALLVSDLCVQPQANIQLNNELTEIYRPEKESIRLDTTVYPEGMLSSFKELYQRNNEVAGWLSFHSDGKTDFLSIEYPVMYSGDNEKYASVDFDQKKNKNGTLFLDARNAIDGYDRMDRSMIVYGHNMASGQMFAGLNKLVGSVSNAKTATYLTFSSLYRKDLYLVFAVTLSDEAEYGKNTYFNYWRTEFEDGDQFLSYVQQVRERSLFEYSTDVRDTDSILILSTCTGRTSANLDDGRVLVFARRVRLYETADQAVTVQKNEDVIMPYNWYVNQDMKPHNYYSYQNNTRPTQTTTTTESTTTESVTSTDSSSTDGETTTTTTTTQWDEQTTGTDTDTTGTTAEETTTTTEEADTTTESSPSTTVTETSETEESTESTDTSEPEDSTTENTIE